MAERGGGEACAKTLRWICIERGGQGERSRVKVEEKLKMQREVRLW